MDDFKIVTHNDGKEKHQSWTAKVELSDYMGYSDYSFYASGYGETEEDAVNELKNALRNMTGLIKYELDG